MSEDLQYTLGQMQATLENINDNLTKLNGRLDHHSNRLGSLERWRATTVGAVAILIVGFAVLVKKFFS